MAPARADVAILDLRDRIELVPDGEHKTFEGASLEAFFTDGTSETVVVPAFRGTPGNRITDEELSQVFRVSAEGRLSPQRIEAALESVWALEAAPDIHALIACMMLD
jgi:2-methylcitrate dehydratase PrpD